MKTTIIMLASVLIASCADAQKLKEAEVPSKVKEAFTKKYPGAKVEKWEKENADYEAEFELNDVESSVVIDAGGNFKETEQEIKSSELPKGITDYCAENFADYKLDEAARITDASGKVTFEAEMKKGKEHFDAIFDDKCNFIKKSTPTNGEEDKD